MSNPEVQKVKETGDRSLPVFAEFEKVADRIRKRAFDLFSSRGHEDGKTLDDWLAAEREICWPKAELTERKTGFKAKVALAGFDGDDIMVTASPAELIVKASHESQADASGDENVCFSEFQSQEVFRRFDLPAEIDVDSVSAEFEHGLLKISAKKLKRTEKQTSKKVDVKSAA